MSLLTTFVQFLLAHDDALAEACWGIGRSASSVLDLTISTGISVGIVLNGRLHRGAGDAHPELGRQIIDPAGPRCYCGARGCLESLASGPALAAWVKENATPQDRMPLNPSARDICQLARVGHPLALQAVERLGRTTTGVTGSHFVIIINPSPILPPWAFILHVF